MAVIRLKKFCSLLFVVFILMSTVFANTSVRTVKVAFVPIEGMQIIDNDGNPKGYMYEYFN